MGADLIGFFANGPMTLDPRRTDQVVEETLPIVEWIWTYRETYDRGSQTEDDQVSQQLKALLQTSPFDLSPDAPLDDLYCTFQCLPLEDKDELRNKQRRQWVEEFVKGWPYFGSDTTCIGDPDKEGYVLVFAGDQTWGDTPTGAGVTQLSRCGLLGIAQAFGVWIGHNFLTLRFSNDGR